MEWHGTRLGVSPVVLSLLPQIEPFGRVKVTKRVPRFGRVRSWLARDPFEFIGVKRKDPLGLASGS